MEYYIKKNGTDFLRAKKGNNVVYAKIEGLRTPFIKQEGYIVERVDRTVTGLIKRSFIHKRNFEKEYMSFNPTLYNPAHVLATIDSFIEEVRPTLSATGKDIVINDITSEGYIKNLRITHQSTQVGTPTPTTPKPILSSGDEGACNVWVHGKNLLDSVLLGDRTKYTLPSWYGGAYKAVAIPLPNGTYRFQTKWATNYASVFQTYSDVTLSVSSFISSAQASGVIYAHSVNPIYNKNASHIISVTEGYAYFSVYGFTQEELTEFLHNVNIQLELGSTATPYEPYNGSITSIDYPDYYVGGSLPDGTKDYIEIDDVNKTAKLYRNIGEVIFNGTETWAVSRTHNFYSEPISNAKEGPIKILCTHSTSEGHYTEEVDSNIFISLTRRVNWYFTHYADVNDFKTWLTNNNVTVQYKLATPIVEDLDYNEVKTYYPFTQIYTNAEILLPEGQVTITTTNNVKADLTVEYRK